MKAVIFVVAAFCVLAGFEHAQAQDMRGPVVGMRFIPNTGGYLEIAGTKGSDVLTVNAAGRNYQWLGGFMHRVGLASESQLAEIRALHPLAVGKSVSFDASGLSVRGNNNTYNHRIEVLRTEEITLPAGRFRTFVIEWRERLLGIAAYAAFIRTYWYAPELGFIVKFDYREEGSALPANIVPWHVKEIDRTRVASTQPPPAATGGAAPAAAALPPPSASAASDTAKRLQELEALRSRGLITEDEWRAKRKAILDAL